MLTKLASVFVFSVVGSIAGMQMYLNALKTPIAQQDQERAMWISVQCGAGAGLFSAIALGVSSVLLKEKSKDEQQREMLLDYANRLIQEGTAPVDELALWMNVRDRLKAHSPTKHQLHQ